MRPKPLSDHRILVVEDNAPLAMFLEEMLRDVGAEVVGPAATLSAAEELIAANGRFSAALLDVRLHAGEEVWPVARLLADQGVPFVFYTAHFDTGSLPPEWSGRPIITKPSRREVIIATLADMVRAR